MRANGKYFTCTICKKLHYRRPSEFNNRATKFCSLKCYWKYRDGKILNNCVVCNQLIVDYKSNKRITCSRLCSNVYRSKIFKGRIITWGDKISKALKGKPNLKLRGRKHTLQHRIKVGLAHKGEKCTFWKGGISKQNETERHNEMKSIMYKDWRNAIFKRDNYTCIWCGYKGKQLRADHIKEWSKYPQLRYKIDNGRTLCNKCHIKRHSKAY